jgi:hypothetical protein
MKKDLNHHSIKQLLDLSTTRIKPSTLNKLQAARMRALEHQRIARSAPVLSWLGHSGTHGSGAHHWSRRLNWALVVLFVACLFSGAAYWQSSIAEHDTSEEDIAILTDDLPLHVYVDPDR